MGKIEPAAHPGSENILSINILSVVVLTGSKATKRNKDPVHFHLGPSITGLGWGREGQDVRERSERIVRLVTSIHWRRGVMYLC